MKTVLITGPMGGGKSEARRYLASLGWPVYDCDSRCKALYETVPGLKERIEESLGIPFSELHCIFSRPELKQRLESIVYPVVAQDIKEWLGEQSASLAFVESATALGHPGFSDMFDTVLLITAPAEVRAARHPESARRSALQHFPRALVNRTIRNTGTIEALQKKIDKYLKTLI